MWTGQFNMDRRTFLILTGGLLAAPLTALAQQPATIPRVGFLYPGSPEGVGDVGLRAFRNGLRELGYVEGKNVQLEMRWGRASSSGCRCSPLSWFS